MMRIRNWSKHQHFKDRRPPWIKLHRELLEDIDWFQLDGDVAKTLVALWLIASESDGELPSVRKLAFRLRMDENALKQQLDSLSHWLEQDDITAISDRYQVGPPETETETETETEGEGEGASASPSPRQTKSVRGHRLPDDWQPSEALLAEGREKWPDLDLAEQTDRFRDYWHAKAGKDATKMDWDGTWRNWMRRAFDDFAFRLPKKDGLAAALAAARE